MKRNVLAFAVGSLLLGVTHLASATTINFNNGGGSYSAGGVSVSVASTGTGAGLFYNSVEDAIGVGNSVTNGGIGCADGGCADIFFGSGFNSTESLTFTFSEKIQLNAISFRQWENNVAGFGDWGRLTYYDGASNVILGSIDFMNSGQGDGPLLDTFFLSNLQLTKFTITGLKGTKQVNGKNVTAWSAFYVHDLDFSSVAVPVPAAAWLMGSGLAGLAGLARRRKASV